MLGLKRSTMRSYETKMQLDVEVSPPAFIRDLLKGSGAITLGISIGYVIQTPERQHHKCNHMIFGLAMK